MVASRRHKTLGSETKVSLLPQNSSSQSILFLCQFSKPQFPHGDTTRVRRHLYTPWVVLKERNLELRKPQSFPSTSKRDTLSSKAVCCSSILEKTVLNKRLVVATLTRHTEMLENQGELYANSRVTMYLGLLGTALANTCCPS